MGGREKGEGVRSKLTAVTPDVIRYRPPDAVSLSLSSFLSFLHLADAPSSPSLPSSLVLFILDVLTQLDERA